MCRGGFVGFAGSCIGHVARSGGRSSVGVRCIRMQTTAMSTSVFPKWRMDGAVASLPHPAKLEKGGEDAYFLQETVAGVFDGVGGWASQGIDPGLYSRKLAVLTEEQLLKGSPLVESLDTAQKKNPLQGSTTACIVRIDSAGIVSVLNVGDSGLLAIRPSEGIYFQTPVQQHYFNCPYQIGSTFQDRASDGSLEEFAVEDGDFLVMATDGVLDNLFNEDIDFVIQTLHKEDEGMTKPSTVANILAQRAQELAVDETYMSPFARNAEEAGFKTQGGKLDDITIIVSRTVRTRAKL